MLKNISGDELKLKGYFIRSAITILNKSYDGDKAVINRLAFKDENLKNLRGLSIYKDPVKYRSALSDFMFEHVCNGLQSLVNEEFHKIWDARTQKFVDLPTDAETDDRNATQEYYDEKLKGLAGQWKGFSWNRKRSSKQVDHINVFRVHIIDSKDVFCKTENAEFSGGMKMIGNTKIAFNFSAGNKNMYLLADIGSKKTLAQVKGIVCAYTDSGDQKVKCGIAVLKKVEIEVPGEEIKSYPSTHTPEMIDLLSFLRGKQNIAPVYDDYIFSSENLTREE